MSEIKRKLVVVGDCCVGKTCLIHVGITSGFPGECQQTMFDNYVNEFHLDNQDIQLSIWDTAGTEDYDRLRPLSYPETDVVIVCFSISSPASLENVKIKWIEEVRQHLPDVPVILVGNMTDLRVDRINDPFGRSEELVTTEAGKTMASSIKARQYFECSALKNEGVEEVFHAAARAAMTYARLIERKKQCVLL